MDVESGWSVRQRAGFGVVLLAAVATVGFAALMGPSGAQTVGAEPAEQAEVAARGGAPVINGCVIQPRTSCHLTDLRGADLGGANLTGADLSATDLRGANLSGAELSGVNLMFARLHGADLSDAYLWRADLNGATLNDADLRGADLRDADLLGASLADTVMPDGSACTATYRGFSSCSWRP